MKKPQYVILIDTREKDPIKFAGETERVSLPAGDYSIKGYKDLIAIERKSMSDLFGSLGVNRDAFEKKIERLCLVPDRHLVIEGNLGDCLSPQRYFSQINPNSVLGSLVALGRRKGIHIWPVGNKNNARRVIRKIFDHFWEEKNV